jgi:hypothetical protein
MNLSSKAKVTKVRQAKARQYKLEVIDMSKGNPEKQRIEELESIRTPKNSHIIDAAIKDGRNANYAALEIIQTGHHLTDEEASQAEANALLAEIHALNAKQPSS